MANEGINLLARVLDGRTGDVSETPQAIDFGEILPNRFLKTNSFSRPIPPRDYIVCRSAEVVPGSRVLVVWVGSDAVVIDAIT